MVAARSEAGPRHNPDFPPGFQVKWLKEKFCADDEKLSGLINKSPCPCALPAPFWQDYQDATGKTNHHKLSSDFWHWTKKQLLLNMAWHNIKDMAEGLETQEQQTKIRTLSEYNIQLDCGNVKIEMKLGKSWRNYALQDKTYLESLITNYADGKTSVPLLRTDETKSAPGLSVESLETIARNERYLFIQAVLLWEKNWMNKQGRNDPDIMNKKQQNGFIKFRFLAEKAGLPKTVTDYRNKAFHNDFPKAGRFSECPDPVKTIYAQLEKQIQRHKEKQKAKHTTYAHKKN